MRLWRLSSQRRARDFDGGYGLSNNGRWSTKGSPVTYCSTVPSLAALEKRVHVVDPSLLPDQTLVEYDVPEDIARHTIPISALPDSWTTREAHTQTLGDQWLDRCQEAILVVPSVIVPIDSAPDRNVLVNHRHTASARITIVAATPFTLDPRLFKP
jgi:RES domain-containing protein